MKLPPPPALEQRCKALAMIDALMSRAWEYRYYSFNRHWSVETNERMASMRNGSGDDYFILFLGDGITAIKGFSHECSALRGETAIPHVLDGIPASLAGFVAEPAFEMTAITFALWYADSRWSRSAAVSPSAIEVDGSAEMLDLLVGGPEHYVAFASEYFERELSPEVVSRFFRLEPLSRELAQSACEGIDWEDLAEDLDEIGYPVAS
jgi:hypothetical protein